jgi:hypothetical protein
MNIHDLGFGTSKKRKKITSIKSIKSLGIGENTFKPSYLGSRGRRV